MFLKHTLDMSLIPKIKIEITFEELCEVCDAFVELPAVCLDRGSKVTRSVLDSVAIKLLKKQLSKRHTTKPFNLSLEFYEAHFLEKWLLIKGNIEASSPAQQFINKLNQKLA